MTRKSGSKVEVTTAILAPDDVLSTGDTVSAEEIRAMYKRWMEHGPRTHSFGCDYPHSEIEEDVQISAGGRLLGRTTIRCKKCQDWGLFYWRALLPWFWVHRLRCPTRKLIADIRAGRVTGMSMSYGSERILFGQGENDGGASISGHACPDSETEA
jgi:hypothetical protein